MLTFDELVKFFSHRCLSGEYVEFFASELSGTEQDLMWFRSSLFYTKSAALPSSLIGEGELNAWIPFQLRSPWSSDGCEFLRSPRLWVDLLQVATGKLRWKPLGVSVLFLTIHDTYRWPLQITNYEIKGLIDALKVIGNPGRTAAVHYFGALEDDSPNFLPAIVLNYRRVHDVKDAGIQLELKKSPELARWRHGIHWRHDWEKPEPTVST
ncbi:MAG: hypothetical protein M3R45_06935 [Pseudomonadota bacterium]|nr:hypothetical protein [Pseudomonadota bacterium]